MIIKTHSESVSSYTHPSIQTQKPDQGKPFLHPAIIHVMSSAQGLTECIGRLITHFHPTPNALPQVPPHLTALVSGVVSYFRNFIFKMSLMPILLAVALGLRRAR